MESQREIVAKEIIETYQSITGRLSKQNSSSNQKYMKQFVTKYSVAYWIVVVILGVLAFATTEGIRWYLLVVAAIMVGYYFYANIQGTSKRIDGK